jgi:signal transduction histidine kinase
MGIAQENRKLAESLQRSNKLLTEANEKLRKVTQAKSQFMDSMSHELRTPLNVIIGFSELMLDEVPGKINEDQRQNLNDILSNGRRLLKMIDDILDKFEMESGENH